MWNCRERCVRSCEHAEPSPESARYAQVGLVGCGLSRDFCGAIVAPRNGFAKAAGLHCLNCPVTVPVGVVVWPASPAAGGAR